MRNVQRLEWLEALSGFAALWVLLHHAHLATSEFVSRDVDIVGLVIAKGFLGVDFFFVLLAFIIAFSLQRPSDRGRGFRDYARLGLARSFWWPRCRLQNA